MYHALSIRFVIYCVTWHSNKDDDDDDDDGWIHEFNERETRRQWERDLDVKGWEWNENSVNPADLGCRECRQLYPSGDRDEVLVHVYSDIIHSSMLIPLPEKTRFVQFGKVAWERQKGTISPFAVYWLCHWSDIVWFVALISAVLGVLAVGRTLR